MVERSCKRARGSRRGTALLVALIAVMVIGALASAMLLSGSTQDGERDVSLEGDKALYVAEAGMSQTIASVANDLIVGFGTELAPIAFGGGSYWTTVVEDGAGAATITSWGRYGQVERATQVVMERDGSGIYDYALYAGNGNGNPGYDLFLDGNGGMADAIQGRVYSGGNVVLSGNARIHGSVEVLGSVSGGSFPANDPPRTGVVVPVPDVAAMSGTGCVTPVSPEAPVMSSLARIVPVTDAVPLTATLPPL